MGNLKDFSFVFFFLVSQLVTKCPQISGYHLLSPPHCVWISLFSQVTTSSSYSHCMLHVFLAGPVDRTGPGGGWHWARQWVALARCRLARDPATGGTGPPCGLHWVDGSGYTLWSSLTIRKALRPMKAERWRLTD